MPNLIDKTNALEWFNALATSCEGATKIQFMRLYVEFMALHGTGDVSTVHLENIADTINDCDAYVWIVVDKTKERQSTYSFEVYIMDERFVESRVTRLIAVVCREDRQGQVKVNYRFEVDQVIKALDPYAKIIHV